MDLAVVLSGFPLIFCRDLPCCRNTAPIRVSTSPAEYGRAAKVQEKIKEVLLFLHFVLLYRSAFDFQRYCFAGYSTTSTNLLVAGGLSMMARQTAQSPRFCSVIFTFSSRPIRLGRASLPKFSRSSQLNWVKNTLL